MMGMGNSAGRRPISIGCACRSGSSDLARGADTRELLSMSVARAAGEWEDAWVDKAGAANDRAKESAVVVVW